MAEFRTTIKKQIRKLSPTGPVSNKYESDLIHLGINTFGSEFNDDLYASETEDAVFPMMMKSLSPPPAPPRRSSLSTTYSGEWTASTATRESSPGAVAAVITCDSGVASSANTSKSVSPIPPFLLASAPQPIKKTPLPADSPLLSPRTASAGSHSRAKSLKRNLRRVRSMRAAGRDCADGPVPSDYNMGKNLNGSNSSLRSDSSSGSSADYKEITLVVRRGSQLGRSGWKVMMADEDGDDLKTMLGDVDLIDRVTASIRSMEFSGRKVPDRITVSCK
jgi:hypothetical protein